MSSEYEMMVDLYRSLGQKTSALRDDDVARLVVHENKVLGANLVPGLEADVEELADGVAVRVRVAEGALIKRQVHMCFGVLPEEGVQRILLDVRVGARGKVNILAHCMFPNAVKVKHLMDAEITVGEGADYAYFERHVHGDRGGVLVAPKARVRLLAGARFATEFELVQGRVGEMEIDYEAWCAERSSLRMVARVAARQDDRLRIREIGHLDGERSVGALLTRIAVRNRAMAEVYNELTASAPHATGHVDCKEIVQDRAVARATPVVSVEHPLARVTHEAAIGSVDSRQLQTLMARGMAEDDAVELIIRGMLKKF